MLILDNTPKLDTTPPILDTNPPTCKLDTNQYYIYHKIVCILTFISMINTTCESLKANNLYFSTFQFYEQLKFHAQLS